jgi:1-phosphofructokinase/tagatose 6-phosphate kinase
VTSRRAPIVTVTPNPAWDVTYEVPALVPGEVHRVTRVHRRLGGKGINAARVLGTLGREAVAVIPGPDGVADDALTLDVVPGLPAIRQTLVVQSADGTTTSLWEPGRQAAPELAEALISRVLGRLRPGPGAAPASTPLAVSAPGGSQASASGGSAITPAGGLVVAGSLPPGLDPRLPARLAEAAVEAGVPVIADTSGPALAEAAGVPGVVLAPNAAELAQLTGVSCHEPAAAIGAARELLDSGPGQGGPRAVVVTLGERGMAAVTPGGTWHGRLPGPLTGNPTGAGDAAVAALITGLVAGEGWPVIVRDAVAASAAAVLSPVAGEISPADYTALRARVQVSEVP